jgi:hypothetical protein
MSCSRYGLPKLLVFGKKDKTGLSLIKAMFVPKEEKAKMISKLLKGLCFFQDGPLPSQRDALSCVSIFYRV